MELVCPIDKKDDAIQRVSAILTAGTSSGSYSGPSGGFVNVGGKSGTVSGYSHLSGYSMTELARIFTPPTEPRKPGKSAFMVLVPSLGCSFWLLVLICLVTYGLLGLLSEPLGDTLLFWTLAIIIGAAVLAATAFLLVRIFKYYDQQEEKKFIREQSKYVVEKPKWDLAIQKWNRLYYCHRHGIVFDSEDGSACEPKDLKEFLYASTSG